LAARSAWARTAALLGGDMPEGSAAAVPAVAPREQLLFDFGWKFTFGHGCDPSRDLGFGFGQGDFAKTGEFEFAQAEPYAKAALHGAQSNLPLVHALLGKIYASQGHTGEAIKELQQALPDDHDGSLHYQIAMLYKKIGDESAAREALEQSEALRKNRERRAQETIQAVE
jgi:tetratricopeptide (TPR) repeat protein